MSEKELRQGIECHLCPEEALCGLCDKARQVLSEPPDVVVLLRWLRAEITGEYVTVGYGLHALGKVMDYIEQKFHVRLTDDDGWEWVEEGE